MDPDVALRIATIADDHTSGATSLAAQAAEVCAIAAEVSHAPGAEQFLLDMAEVGGVLMAAQPAMASLFHLANTVLHAAERAPLEAKRAAVQATARGFAASLTRKRDKMVEAALAAMSSGKVLTHSASQVVEATLIRAHAAGLVTQIICTESRPLNEGVALAGRLAQAGIAVTVVADALAPSLVGEVGCVLVGADTVCPAGVVNKAGTYPLALAAHRAGIPVLVLAGAEKFLPPAMVDVVTLIGEEREPGELGSAPPGVTVLNRAFDLTPLAVISQVITERGPRTGDAIAQACAAIQVHRLLQ